MVEKLSAETRLRVAELCCEFYIREGSTQPSISEIAAAAGVSDRTFYRYFATKADSIGPVFDDMTARMNSGVAGWAGEDVRTAVVGAFASMFTSPVTSKPRKLFQLVFADPEMWALFLRKVHDGETTLAPVLAQRLHVPADGDRARVAAAAVASSTRIALERLSIRGADLQTEFVALLDAFGPALFVADSPQGGAAHQMSIGGPRD